MAHADLVVYLRLERDLPDGPLDDLRAGHDPWDGEERLVFVRLTLVAAQLDARHAGGQVQKRDQRMRLAAAAGDLQLLHGLTAVSSQAEQDTPH